MKKTRVILQGALGRGLQTSCAGRLKTVDYAFMVEPFRLRNEKDGAWRCEFWGKVLRSAILTNFHLQDPELDAMIRKTVSDMLDTQTPDGCISSYPEEKQTTGWDIWGRKYVLLALLRYYDLVEQDERVKNGCIRMLDHLMTQVGPGKKEIIDCGWHDGLAASSILGAVVGVYRISGEKRFLEFARYIISTGCSKKNNIFNAVLEGVPPCQLGNGKAYEMTSCFQGMAELYLLHPEPAYRTICEKYFSAVCKREIFVTGAAGAKDVWGEYWYDGAFKQTFSDAGGLGETCVTATLLHYCARVAEMTGDSRPLDVAECSLYNSILGVMAPDGSRWAHVNPTPLTGGGSKVPADDQIGRGFKSPFDGHDCCRAQGPEGLAMAPELAVTCRKGGAALNFFEPLQALLPGGEKITVTGNYPVDETAAVSVEAPEVFTLFVRIPSFCTALSLNGEKLEITPGTYAEISRVWNKEDKLLMTFDLAIRETTAPADPAYTAFLRGPLVLATDSRGEVPEALFQTDYKGLHLVDYISAGKEMCKENTLTVWHKL